MKKRSLNGNIYQKLAYLNNLLKKNESEKKKYTKEF